jgi:hypothetical protein
MSARIAGVGGRAGAWRAGGDPPVTGSLSAGHQLAGDSRPKLLGSEAGGLLIHLTVSRLNQVCGPADFTAESVTATG